MAHSFPKIADAPRFLAHSSGAAVPDEAARREAEYALFRILVADLSADWLVIWDCDLCPHPGHLKIPLLAVSARYGAAAICTTSDPAAPFRLKAALFTLDRLCRGLKDLQQLATVPCFATLPLSADQTCAAATHVRDALIAARRSTAIVGLYETEQALFDYISARSHEGPAPTLPQAGNPMTPPVPKTPPRRATRSRPLLVATSMPQAGLPPAGGAPAPKHLPPKHLPPKHWTPKHWTETDELRVDPAAGSYPMVQSTILLPPPGAPHAQAPLPGSPGHDRQADDRVLLDMTAPGQKTIQSRRPRRGRLFGLGSAGLGMMGAGFGLWTWASWPGASWRGASWRGASWPGASWPGGVDLTPLAGQLALLVATWLAIRISRHDRQRLMGPKMGTKDQACRPTVMLALTSPHDTAPGRREGGRDDGL